MLAVRLDFPAADLMAFVAHAKANPGKVTLGHAGVGSSNYLICRAFMDAAKVDVTLVSYRGAGPALNDLMGGQIDGVCDAATSLSGALQGQKVRALVVATPLRLSGFPDVPTSTEAGLPEFQAQGWNALFAPRDTPDGIIEKLNSALKTALAGELISKRFAELSSVVPGGEELAPAHMDRLIPGEIEKYRKLILAK